MAATAATVFSVEHEPNTDPAYYYSQTSPAYCPESPNYAPPSSSLSFLRFLAREVISTRVGKNRDVTLHRPSHGPRSVEKRCTTGRPVKTDEASLAHTREIWEREICETLQHASFVNITERFVEEEKESLISSHQREMQHLRGVNDVCKREMLTLKKDTFASLKRVIRERDELRKEIVQLQNKIQNECEKRDSGKDCNRPNKRQYTQQIDSNG
ncbi:hypothetical protein CYMTET_44740 [Cymbomonas tetramitiformis]|uniref:Uncharacterized protein n=1 Tax=Cymbomonas tetramitiformis TaxID=36881 RepID=A0AAE0C0T2_9CHLO|nr:hypothetical protein CYMTET_44743 [Cymbomonas tetramitiformis]KAK3245711.1 hypothetical protein CYMTET_44740 [Cymbomonas tetramitiformis]